MSRGLHRLRRREKRAQFGRPYDTLGDVVDAVRADRGLTPYERSQVETRLASDLSRTPLGASVPRVVAQLGGAALGGAVANYFGASKLTQALSAAGGFGLGTALHDRMRKGF